MKRDEFKMRVQKTAVTGTMESSDIMVTIAPNGSNGVEIDLDSTVEKQFGKSIRQAIAQTLASLDITDAKVIAVDKGALDCVIRARVLASGYRACGNENYKWGESSK